MRRTLVLLKFVVPVISAYALLAAPLLAIPLKAKAQSGSPQTAGNRAEAQNLLRKIQTAAQRLNYSGTFVYQQSNQVRTSRITHVVDARNELEKLEVLDGKPREYIRNNEEIICYMPESRTLLVEKRVTKDVFPAIVGAGPSKLSEHYNIRKAESGRVAGYDCQAIILEPKDNLRYGYKLWAEKSSGLLLRAQTIGEKGEIVEQIAFTQLTIGNVDRSRVKPSFPNTRGWRIENAQMSQVSLSDWAIKSVPAGFKKIREIKRSLSDSGDSGTANAQREVSQIVYSDGLAAISIFIEPGSQSRTEGSMQQGAMNVVAKRQGDFWLTIVGEVPSTAIRQVANSIEYKPTKQ